MKQQNNQKQKSTTTQSSQDKGLLLAKLLQKAVQNKNKSQNVISKSANINSQQSVEKEKQLDFSNDVSTSVNQTKQSFHKKAQNFALFKPKFPNFHQNNSSFQDSMTIDPSFLTNSGQQVAQMLKYIYTEIFGEQKYILDKKRYQQIEQNPDQYKFQQYQDFNKEGKMLQNIINQIRITKSNSKKLQYELTNFEKQLNQAYLQIQKQQKIILQANNHHSINKISEDDANNSNKNSILVLEQQNIFLKESMKSLQQEVCILEQSLRQLQKEYEDKIIKLQKQSLMKDKQLCKLQQLEQVISCKDKQIEHLLLSIGQLQIELNHIKDEISMKERQQSLKLQKQIHTANQCEQMLLQNYTPEKKASQNQDHQNTLDLRRLSTIRQQEEPTIKQQKDSINITDFVQERSHKIQKEVQTDQFNQKHQKHLINQTQNLSNKTYQMHNTYTKNSESTEIQKIIFQLKKVLVQKQKIILAYEKQIQNHQTEVQNYEAFISQLSSQIEVCQSKLAENHRLQQEMINRKVQTDEKYFQLLKQNQSVKYNQQLTYGQRQDGFLFAQYEQKQPSIADEIDIKQRNNKQVKQVKQVKEVKEVKQVSDNLFTFKKVTDDFFIDSHPNQISHIAGKQKYWDQCSVSLSQFSQTQELKDIRNLTKQLSQAYDKIITLTYEVNSLKKMNLSKFQNQINPATVNMFKHK